LELTGGVVFYRWLAKGSTGGYSDDFSSCAYIFIKIEI